MELISVKIIGKRTRVLIMFGLKNHALDRSITPQVDRLLAIYVPSSSMIHPATFSAMARHCDVQLLLSESDTTPLSMHVQEMNYSTRENIRKQQLTIPKL